MDVEKVDTLAQEGLRCMSVVAIRCTPSLYVINLLVPSSFLVAIDTLSFYLPAESKNRAPFKTTLLLGYNVFLLTVNDLLPATGTPLISIVFPSVLRIKARCLLRPVPVADGVSLLETIFITYLLHLATTQPPSHALVAPFPASPLHQPRKMLPPWAPEGKCEASLQVVGKVPGPREAELSGCPGSGRAQQEDKAQKQHLVGLWVQFSHMMDTLLFCLYLLFLATSIITVIVLWNTEADRHLQAPVWSFSCLREGDVKVCLENNVTKGYCASDTLLGECISISKLTVSAENLWLPDSIMESCMSGLGKASTKPICKELPKVSTGTLSQLIDTKHYERCLLRPVPVADGVSLLETIFITYLLHLATTQPPSHALVAPFPASPLHQPRKMLPPWAPEGKCEASLQIVGKVPGPREAELSGCPGSGRAQQEDKAQKQHLVGLWVQFSHMMDTLLFCLYLLFLATSIITVIVL
ncbi:5-Hydroxytryptamine Receptor 3C [Manis pentadactyla]|nr:5-Hydroxytryptamine Receptor 3C [Manis pentadactyla]